MSNNQTIFITTDYICLYSDQVDFYGETGRIVFDAFGHREDYELGFYELNSSRSQPEEVNRCIAYLFISF